jgi:hypothetical protein
MRFLTLYTPNPNNPPAGPAHYEAMGKLMDEMAKKGHLIATGGIAFAAHGLRAKLADGKFTTESAPADAKFMKASGFALLQANSMEELLPEVRRFLEVAGDGESDIIPLADGPPPA